MSTRKECELCHRPVQAKGLCQLHYQRQRRNKDHSKTINRLEKLMTSKCCLSGCPNHKFQHNLCYTHFHEVMDNGRPKWLPGEKKEYNPKKETSSRCIIKKCKETPEQGKICKDHTEELEEIHANRDAFNKDIEQKIRAFEVKEVSLDDVDFEDNTFKMRQHIEEEATQKLARSIREIGLLHLPVYMKVPGRKKKPYRIVSG
ncbi:MAG: hypothetical protein ABEH43_01815, partial [Flavobacteriales bacterium]